MKIHIPDNCGNSPRSLLAIEIATGLAANQYDQLEPLLAEDFSWSVAGSDFAVTKEKLKVYTDKAAQAEVSVSRFDIMTAISHGKYAAVSSQTYLSNGSVSYNHDLYEFTGAGSSAKLRKVLSYPVDTKA